jgi:hypothetical protein
MYISLEKKRPLNIPLPKARAKNIYSVERVYWHLLYVPSSLFAALKKAAVAVGVISLGVLKAYTR